MTELTCDICRDLIPLVVDGVASEESEAAVKEHVAVCAECRDMYQNELERGIASLREKTADEKVLRRVRIRLAWQGMLLTFAALAVTTLTVRTVFLLWMLPAVGAASPTSTAQISSLPEPSTPQNPSTSPFFSSKLTWLNAPNRLKSFTSRITSSVGTVCLCST